MSACQQYKLLDREPFSIFGQLTELSSGFTTGTSLGLEVLLYLSGKIDGELFIEVGSPIAASPVFFAVEYEKSDIDITLTF